MQRRNKLVQNVARAIARDIGERMRVGTAKGYEESMWRSYITAAEAAIEAVQNAATADVFLPLMPANKGRAHMTATDVRLWLGAALEASREVSDAAAK